MNDCRMHFKLVEWMKGMIVGREVRRNKDWKDGRRGRWLDGNEVRRMDEKGRPKGT